MNSLWTHLARVIANHPRLVDWLIARAQRTPYFHIHGQDGSLYMRRWWLLPRWALCFNPSTQAMEPKSWHRAAWRWLRWAPRIHHIVRPDVDRALHDHPFDFRTLVLRGEYREENIVGHITPVLAGQTYRSRAERFHRIDEISASGVWTLFITGPRINGWGFLVNGHKVPWRQYLGDQSTTEHTETTT